MKFTLVPEYRFETFDLVTAEFLLSIGVKGVLLDIDNTLEPYEHDLPGERVISWLKSFSEHNIRTAIISNNNRERVEKFNKNIGMPASGILFGRDVLMRIDFFQIFLRVSEFVNQICLFHPFTAPITTPLAKYFWMKG